MKTQVDDALAEVVSANHQLYQAEQAAQDALGNAYDLVRKRYYGFLADDRARQWVVLMEPQFTIEGQWTAALSNDDVKALRIRIEKMRELANAIDELLAED